MSYCVPPEWRLIIPGSRLEVEKVDEQNLWVEVRVETRLLQFNLAEPLTSSDEAFPTTNDIDKLASDAYPEKDATVELQIGQVKGNKLKKRQLGEPPQKRRRLAGGAADDEPPEETPEGGGRCRNKNHHFFKHYDTLPEAVKQCFDEAPLFILYIYIYVYTYMYIYIYLYAYIYIICITRLP
jgi:hypothetical protein